MAEDKQEEVKPQLPYKKCLNCGTELTGMYCHNCGQYATSNKFSLKGFIIEYLGNAYMWDSQFVKSIWNLACRPGGLTNDYMAGKFVSHVHPIKLNMFFVFIFITIFVFLSGTEKMTNKVHEITNDEKIYSVLNMDYVVNDAEYSEKIKTSAVDTVLLYTPKVMTQEFSEVLKLVNVIEDSNGKSYDKLAVALPHVLIEDSIIILNDDGYYHFNKDFEHSVQSLDIFNSIWVEMVEFTSVYLPLIILLTAPFLAISLYIVNRKRKLSFVLHFIFSLHYIAFLELVFLVAFILYITISPSREVLELFFALSSCSYLTLAIRNVYEKDSWFKTIIKMIFANLFYIMICFVVFCIIFIIGCFSVIDEIAV